MQNSLFRTKRIHFLFHIGIFRSNRIQTCQLWKIRPLSDKENEKWIKFFSHTQFLRVFVPSFSPKWHRQQYAIVWHHSFFKFFFRALSVLRAAFRAKTSTVKHRAKQVVPQLHKESRMKRFVFDGFRVVAICHRATKKKKNRSCGFWEFPFLPSLTMLKRRVDKRMVCIRIRQFVTGMQINTVRIEEERVDGENHIDVDGQQRKQQHGCCSHKLIHVFISNDRKWRRIVKNVMESGERKLVEIKQKFKLVSFPANSSYMTKAMIICCKQRCVWGQKRRQTATVLPLFGLTKFKKIARHNHHNSRSNQVSPSIFAQAAIGTRISVTRQP